MTVQPLDTRNPVQVFLCSRFPTAGGLTLFTYRYRYSVAELDDLRNRMIHHHMDRLRDFTRFSVILAITFVTISLTLAPDRFQQVALLNSALLLQLTSILAGLIVYYLMVYEPLIWYQQVETQPHSNQGGPVMALKRYLVQTPKLFQRLYMFLHAIQVVAFAGSYFCLFLYVAFTLF